MSKSSKITFWAITIGLLFELLPIILIIVFCTTYSDNKVKCTDFPTTDVWVCQTEDYTITIDLSNSTEEMDFYDVIDNANVSLVTSTHTYILKLQIIFRPGTHFLGKNNYYMLCSKDNSQDDKYISVCSQNYSFDENNIYFKNLVVAEDCKDIFTENSTLQFVKQTI